MQLYKTASVGDGRCIVAKNFLVLGAIVAREQHRSCSLLSIIQRSQSDKNGLRRRIDAYNSEALI